MLGHGCRVFSDLLGMLRFTCPCATSRRAQREMQCDYEFGDVHILLPTFWDRLRHFRIVLHLISATPLALACQETCAIFPWRLK